MRGIAPDTAALAAIWGATPHLRDKQEGHRDGVAASVSTDNFKEQDNSTPHRRGLQELIYPIKSMT